MSLGIAASAVWLLAGSSVARAALPVLPPGDNTENIIFQDDFSNGNWKSWSNIATGSGTATIAADPLMSGVTAWYPSVNSNGTGVSSTLTLPVAVDLANGAVAVYMRVRVDGGNLVEGNRFSVTLTEATPNNRYGALTIRPGDKAVLGYRNSSGSGVPSTPNGLTYSFPAGSSTYQDFRLVLTKPNPAAVPPGDYLQLDASYYNATSGAYVSLGSVPAANISTGIFNRLGLFSRNNGGRAYFDSVMVTQQGSPRATAPANAYRLSLPLPAGVTIQSALDAYGSVVLAKGDYSGGAAFTLRSGQKLYGDPAGTTIPPVTVEAGTTGAVISSVSVGGSGTVTFPASTTAVTSGCVFDRLGGHIQVNGGILENNLFVHTDGKITIDTTTSGYVRNNRFIRTKAHAWSNQLVMLGDSQRNSYGNVFLWKNFLTPAGDSTNINNQEDLTFVGVDAETWNFNGAGTGAALWNVGRMGTLRIFGINGGSNGGLSVNNKTGIFDVDADEFQLYNDSMGVIGGNHTGDFTVDFESPSYASGDSYSAATNSGTLARTGPQPNKITALSGPSANSWTATVENAGATGQRLLFANTVAGPMAGTLEAYAPPGASATSGTWFAQMDYTRLTSQGGFLGSMRLLNNSGTSTLGHPNNATLYADNWEGHTLAVGSTNTLRVEIDMGTNRWRTYFNGVLANSYTSAVNVTVFGGLQFALSGSGSYNAGNVFALDNIQVGTLTDYQLGPHNARSLLVNASSATKAWRNEALTPFRLKAFDGWGVNDVATSTSSTISPGWSVRTSALPTSPTTPDEQLILRGMVVTPTRPAGQVPWESPNHSPIPDPAGPNWATNLSTQPDSTGYIQGLIDANGVARLPAGVYYISQPLKLSRLQGIIGAGADTTVIIAKTNTLDMIVANDSVTTQTNTQITLADITLQGGGNGIHFEPVGTSSNLTPPIRRAQYTGCYINHVTFRNMSTAGIFMDQIYALDNIFFGYVHFTNCDAGLKQLTDPLYTGGDAPDDPHAARMMYMDKCAFYKCQFVGNRLALDLPGHRGCNLNAWINCLFQNNSGGAAAMGNYVATVFANCDFSNNGGTAVLSNNYTINHVGNGFVAGSNGQAMFGGPVSAEGCAFDRAGSTTATILSGSNSSVFLNNCATSNMPIGLPTGTGANGMLINTALGMDASLNQQVVSLKNGTAITLLPGTPAPAPQLLFGSDWSLSTAPTKDY